ncbi:MAG: serine protease [Marinilabiliales bacterium]|nr:serine protease [Marinilabiliales bacterium]
MIDPSLPWRPTAISRNVRKRWSSTAKGPYAMKLRTSSPMSNADLCIVEAPGMRLPVAKLGRASRLSAGEPLYLYGFPRAIGMAFSQGQVKSLHPYRSGVIIETTADFTEGASGGGHFQQQWRTDRPCDLFLGGEYERHYFAIPSDWIGDLVALDAAEKSDR